jgi:hypothetical protein
LPPFSHLDAFALPAHRRRDLSGYFEGKFGPGVRVVSASDWEPEGVHDQLWQNFPREETACAGEFAPAAALASPRTFDRAKPLIDTASKRLLE